MYLENIEFFSLSTLDNDDNFLDERSLNEVKSGVAVKENCSQKHMTHA